MGTQDTSPPQPPQPGPRTPRTSIHETVQQGVSDDDDVTAWMSTISPAGDVSMGAHAADAEEVQIYALHDDADEASEAEVEITIGSNPAYDMSTLIQKINSSKLSTNEGNA